MKGVYVLLISVNKDLELSVGSLGLIDFKKGFYAYVGSAQNNLEKRVKRHLSINKKKHWHIDYLLDEASVSVKKVFYKTAGKDEECRIAGSLLINKEPVLDFGSSDCKCRSHLFKLEKPSDLLSLGMSVL